MIGGLFRDLGDLGDPASIGRLEADIAREQATIVATAEELSHDVFAVELRHGFDGLPWTLAAALVEIDLLKRRAELAERSLANTGRVLVLEQHWRDALLGMLQSQMGILQSQQANIDKLVDLATKNAEALAAMQADRDDADWWKQREGDEDDDTDTDLN